MVMVMGDDGLELRRPRDAIPSSKSTGLLDLPREVLRLIAEHIYDPLVLTQQDRLSESRYGSLS